VCLLYATLARKFMRVGVFEVGWGEQCDPSRRDGCE
jgi:hypothetical protein